jgi:hypothetical protein
MLRRQHFVAGGQALEEWNPAGKASGAMQEEKCLAAAAAKQADADVARSMGLFLGRHTGSLMLMPHDGGADTAQAGPRVGRCGRHFLLDSDPLSLNRRWLQTL